LTGFIGPGQAWGLINIPVILTALAVFFFIPDHNRPKMLKKLFFLVWALIFIPLGILVIKSSFDIPSPHVFVMLIFSGSLMVLLGLTGIVGLLAKDKPREESSE
jgi:hypothetical protein